MRANTIWMLALTLVLGLFVGCNGTEQTASETDTAGKTTGGAAAHPTNPMVPTQSPTTAGKVLATMNAGDYTYVQVDTGSGPAWYAGPQTRVAVGDTVSLPSNAMPMRNFESKTLGRTFDVLYFVEAIDPAGGTAPTAAPAAGSMMGKAHGSVPTAASGTDLTGIAKAEGGMTVAEIFKAGKGAQGREVVLRGKVVKVNSGIMGKNWLHVRDGSGEDGTNDLTITTNDMASVGDTVLVTGKLSADRDFGYGYEYDLLIEDAKVVVE